MQSGKTTRPTCILIDAGILQPGGFRKRIVSEDIIRREVKPARYNHFLCNDGKSQTGLSDMPLISHSIGVTHLVAPERVRLLHLTTRDVDSPSMFSYSGGKDTTSRFDRSEIQLRPPGEYVVDQFPIDEIGTVVDGNTRKVFE